MSSTVAEASREDRFPAPASSVAASQPPPLVLAAWASGNVPLTSLYLPRPTMKTNAAVCALCSALANLIFLTPTERRLRAIGLGLAVVCRGDGGLTLSEHIAGWDLGIDQLIFREMPGAQATGQPQLDGTARPSPTSCSVCRCSSAKRDRGGGARRVSSSRSSSA